MIALSGNETKHITRSDRNSRYQKFIKYYLFSNETNINSDFATFCGRLRYGLHFCVLDAKDVDAVFPHLQSFTMAAEEMSETTSMMQQIKELHESMQVHMLVV